MRKLVVLVSLLALPTVSLAQVTSVFGRTGAVTAQTGDYSIGQISGAGTAAQQNVGTSGANVPLLNGNNSWSGSDTFGPQTNISVPYDGTTPLPTNIPIFAHTGAFNSGIVSARTAAVLQIVGIPQYAAGSDGEVNLLNLFAYGGDGAYNLERYDRGTVPTTAATSTSSPTLHFANTPFWVTAGAVVSDSTTGLSVGTVQSTTGTTITLTANAANAVGSGDVLNIIGVNNGAVQNAEGLGNLGFDPYDGVSDGNTAGLSASTTETQVHSPGHHGTMLTLYYTPNANLAPPNRLTGISISAGGTGGVAVGAPTGGTNGDLGTGTLNVQSDVVTGGHFRSRGGAPTLSSCGSGGSVTGTDTAGQVFVGTTAVTSCIVNFSTAWPSAPICVAVMKSNTSPLMDVNGTSTTGVQVQFSAGFTGTFFYICQGIS